MSGAGEKCGWDHRDAFPRSESIAFRFKQMWLCGDAGFAKPEAYEFCEVHRTILFWFMRLMSTSDKAGGKATA
jgi:hypothetical protein